MAGWEVLELDGLEESHGCRKSEGLSRGLQLFHSPFWQPVGEV